MLGEGFHTYYTNPNQSLLSPPSIFSLKENQLVKQMLEEKRKKGGKKEKNIN